MAKDCIWLRARLMDSAVWVPAQGRDDGGVPRNTDGDDYLAEMVCTTLEIGFAVVVGSFCSLAKASS